MKHLLQKTHRFSAFILSIFIAVHLLNHLAALAGPPTHINVMMALRNVYRHPYVEPVLLIGVVIQIGSGILLVVTQQFWKSVLKSLQAISGLYLGFFLVYHVRAILLARFSWKVETDFFFAANVAVDPATRAFFLPYYFFAIVSIFLHVACAHYSRRMLLNADRSLENQDFGKQVAREAVLIGLSGLIIAVLVTATFGGFLYRINGG
nr:hypothetical protein [uncultured Dyadobacter sp.]